MSLHLETPRLFLTYEPDIETLDWIGGGRCGIYYLWFEAQHVGAISMTSRSKGNGEIGYELEADYRGRGFATEALAAVVAVAHDRHGFSLLAAQAYADNGASQRVLTKTGFIRVGSKLCWSEHRRHPVTVVTYHRHTVEITAEDAG